MKDDEVTLVFATPEDAAKFREMVARDDNFRGLWQIESAG